LSVSTPTADDVRASWIRLLSLSRQGNPAVDTTGMNCAAAQSDARRWFLQGTLGGSANRACTIPPNREIVCNVISYELSDPELPGQNLSNQQLTNAVQNSINQVDLASLRFILDNQSLINRTQWRKFRVLTQPSQVFLPNSNYDNLFRVQGGYSTRFAADGYHVKLTGLSPGPHALYFGGTIRDPGGIPIFETAVNYSLTQL
jgi:hypothetical protein